MTKGGGASVEKWELAYQDYMKGMKYKDIAEKYDVSINTVKSWKSRKWGTSPSKKGTHKTNKVAHKRKLQPVIENDELTERQKMFCLIYLKCFNATKAYQQAYQVDYPTANAHGYKLLSNVVIKKELHKLKAELQKEVYFEAIDLINEYAKQAFADITDYTEFGQELVKFEDGEERIVSHVHLKNSTEVDGTLIQEVKKGKDGVSVKLYDKQKAMHELVKLLPYIDSASLLTSQERKTIAEAKLKEFEASKLDANSDTNELLKSLLDVVSGGDGDA